MITSSIRVDEQKPNHWLLPSPFLKTQTEPFETHNSLITWNCFKTRQTKVRIISRENIIKLKNEFATFICATSMLIRSLSTFKLIWLHYTGDIHSLLSYYL